MDFAQKTNFENFSPSSSDAGQLRTAILRFGSDGGLCYWNLSAAEMFADCLRHGLLVGGFIVAIRRNGLTDDIAATELTAAIEAKRPQHLLRLRGGHMLLVSISVLADDSLCFEASDVTDAMNGELAPGADALTGLPVKTRLIEALEAASTAAIQQRRAPLALLYIAFDTSEIVDNALDRATIDSTIRLAASRIRKCLGQGDTAFRCGSGVAVLQSVTGEQPASAEALSNRLIDMLERTYLINSQIRRIRVSVGIAFRSRETISAEQLVSNAILAAARASKSSVSRSMIYSEAIIEEATRRYELETSLRRALVLGEFWLAYQPQYEIAGRRLLGFEALVRWSDPEKGLVSPADFIPLAEETGLIQELGAWVMKAACMEAASWPKSLAISVNLSPLQMRSARIVEIVKTTLIEAGLEPGRLDLEITENALIGDVNQARSILDLFKGLGVKVSIDDFGTGYSSLSYLQNFRFDKIKIDQSFVRNLEHNADSRAIVSAITALANALGIVTIAEGVETDGQLQIIADAGCAQVQGYLTGRPIPPSDLRALISTI